MTKKRQGIKEENTIKTELEILQDAINKYNPKDILHFENGWEMFPEWWSSSTESWKLGYLAKQVSADKFGKGPGK